jgi:N-acetylneuraminic acid mutarotase
LPTTTAAVAGAEGTTGPAPAAAAAAPLTSPGAWTQLHPSGDLPPGRCNQSMVFEHYRGGAFVFGGSSHLALASDTWGYDPAANAWTELGFTGATPDARFDSVMAWDSNDGKVYLFGGQNQTTYFNDIWGYDSKSDAWIYLGPPGTLPPARSGCMMAYDSPGRRVILFGGASYPAGCSSETWAFDGGTSAWTNLNPSGTLPPARYQGAMVYDANSGRVILFGGTDGSTSLNDTWAYDPVANAWTDLSPSGALPPARSMFGMAYDSSKERVVVFGGLNSTPTSATYLNDLWAYDAAANAWTELSPPGTLPSARTGASLVFDSLSGDLLLFGGWDGESELNDLWAYRLP